MFETSPLSVTQLGRRNGRNLHGQHLEYKYSAGHLLIDYQCPALESPFSLKITTLLRTFMVIFRVCFYSTQITVFTPPTDERAFKIVLARRSRPVDGERLPNSRPRTPSSR